MSEYKFGELVKARLAELKMSQNELAKRVMRGRSYINYVVSGKNTTAKNKTSKPGPEPVALIARELGIPVDEALVAAGWPQYVDKAMAGQGAFAVTPKAKRPGKSTDGEADAASEVMIDLPGKMHLILVNRGDALTDEQIDRFRVAFRTAAEIVRK